MYGEIELLPPNVHRESNYTCTACMLSVRGVRDPGSLCVGRSGRPASGYAPYPMDQASLRGDVSPRVALNACRSRRRLL